MSEFCKECYKEIFAVSEEEEEIIMSEESELCERCGKTLPIVVTSNPKNNEE